jgi:hypothetical protein
MKLLALSALLLALSSAKKNKEPPPPADPYVAVAKTHGGKVWTQEKAPAADGEALRAWLAQNPPASGEVGRKGKDGPWTFAYVAVFKKPIAKGPVTVQFFDKEDPKNIVDQGSPANDAATLVYQGIYELDPDHGFNKGHTYVMKVGQIIKGKFQPYATGELTLK